jgi:hypothetical protein
LIKEVLILPKYTFNKEYFDVINTKDKAYWLGFIWCDGYVCKRIRNNGRIEYNLKLSLSEQDGSHLEKFKLALSSTHPIKKYKVKSFNNEICEYRFFLSNNYLPKKLYEEYGLIPHRHNIENLINKIPETLVSHFIRGVFDAEGSINYSINYDGNKLGWRKYDLTITTYHDLLIYIDDKLIKQKIFENKHKLYHRHKNGDLHCRSLKICGNRQILNMLHFIYKDSNDNIRLERKYQRYLDMLNYMQNKNLK